MGWQVSVKGVVRDAGGAVLLARNDRDEWELPGGRLEPGETPAGCVAREIREETGLEVEVRTLLGAEVFEVVPDREVLVVSYGCEPASDPAGARRSHEHREVRFVGTQEIGQLRLPAVYRRAIALWPADGAAPGLMSRASPSA